MTFTSYPISMAIENSHWHYIEYDGQPPFGQRVIASDGTAIWLDMIFENPNLRQRMTWQSRVATMWSPIKELPR